MNGNGMFKMPNHYGVWDITFCKYDDNGDVIEDKNGKPILYTDDSGKLDFSWLGEVIDEDNEKYLTKVEE